MREVLEEILTHADGDRAATSLAEIRRYTKLFWINSGPHNNLTARKFVLGARRRRSARPRDRGGGTAPTFPRRDGETLDALLDRLHGPFFDPAVDPMVTCKTPGEGRDILAASANNLYAGVTMADLETVRASSTASTRGWSSGTAGSSKRCIASAARYGAADRRTSSGICRRRCRTRRRRCGTRSRR